MCYPDVTLDCWRVAGDVVDDSGARGIRSVICLKTKEITESIAHVRTVLPTPADLLPPVSFAQCDTKMDGGRSTLSVAE